MGVLEQFNGYLMSRDDVLAIIEGGQIARVMDAARLPFHFIYAKDSSLESWIRQRAVDTARTNSRFLLREIDPDQSDIVNLVLSVNAASVTDTYWLKEQNSLLTYQEIRFKNDDLARVALLGSSAGIQKPNRHTAELTNTGSFEKCWRIENGRWWLYKRGEIENSFSELACQEIGQYLGLTMAVYERVEREEIERVFRCRVPLAFSAVRTLDFTEGAKWNFEPAADLGCRRDDAVHNYGVLDSLCPAAADQYKEMVLLDALIYNLDRHLYNYGILRDVETGEVLSLAPIYDQNLALSMVLLDYDHIMAGERDEMFYDWARLVDDQMVQVKIPQLGREKMERIISGITMPEMPMDMRQQVIDVLVERGRWIEEKVQQINRVYPDPAGQKK